MVEYRGWASVQKSEVWAHKIRVSFTAWDIEITLELFGRFLFIITSQAAAETINPTPLGRPKINDDVTPLPQNNPHPMRAHLLKTWHHKLKVTH